MRFDVLTLFPEIFQGYLGQSLLKRAIQAGLVDVQLHNIRDWSKRKHNTVDDRPFGGGPGMVMMVAGGRVRRGGASRGRRRRATWSCSRRKDAGSISRPSNDWRRTSGSSCLCGRYEGFDERIRLILEPEEISIGDFVLNGGEVAAMAIIDAIIRLCRACWETKTAARAIRFRASGGGWSLPNTRGRGSIAAWKCPRFC